MGTKLQRLCTSERVPKGRLTKPRPEGQGLQDGSGLQWVAGTLATFLQPPFL